MEGDYPSSLIFSSPFSNAITKRYKAREFFSNETYRGSTSDSVRSSANPNQAGYHRWTKKILPNEVDHMSSDRVENGSISIMALESGIKYASLEEAPDEPLLVELIGIRPDDLAKISQHFEIDLEDLKDVQDLDERPRLQIEDKFTMLVVRVPVDLRVEDRAYSTNPIGMFTNGRDIIVIQNDEVPRRKNRLRERIRFSFRFALQFLDYRK